MYVSLDATLSPRLSRLTEEFRSSCSIVVSTGCPKQINAQGLDMSDLPAIVIMSQSSRNVMTNFDVHFEETIQKMHASLGDYNHTKDLI